MAVPGSVELSEITSGALFVAAQQELKKLFPQLQNIPTWVISLLWAVVSVLIIGYEWTPNVGGGGVLTITVPSLAAAIMGLWKLGEQFAVNEILYGGSEILKGTVKPEATPAGAVSSTPTPAPTPQPSASQPPVSQAPAPVSQLPASYPSAPMTQSSVPQPYPSQPPLPPSRYSMPEAQK